MGKLRQIGHPAGDSLMAAGVTAALAGWLAAQAENGGTIPDAYLYVCAIVFAVGLTWFLWWLFCRSTAPQPSANQNIANAGQSSAPIQLRDVSTAGGASPIIVGDRNT